METPNNLKIIQSKAEYIIHCKYLDNNDTERNANVKLLVDFNQKKFDVIPVDGSDNFKFKQNSHQHKMWKAVTSAIITAIDLGNVLLEDFEELNK